MSGPTWENGEIWPLVEDLLMNAGQGLHPSSPALSLRARASGWPAPPPARRPRRPVRLQLQPARLLLEGRVPIHSSRVCGRSASQEGRPRQTGGRERERRGADALCVRTQQDVLRVRGKTSLADGGVKKRICGVTIFTAASVTARLGLRTPAQSVTPRPIPSSTP